MAPFCEKYNQVPPDIRLLVKEYLANETNGLAIATLVNLGFGFEYNPLEMKIEWVKVWSELGAEDHVKARRSPEKLYSVKGLIGTSNHDEQAAHHVRRGHRQNPRNYPR